jgi:hypothetical protein
MARPRALIIGLVVLLAGSALAKSSSKNDKKAAAQGRRPARKNLRAGSAKAKKGQRMAKDDPLYALTGDSFVSSARAGAEEYPVRAPEHIEIAPGHESARLAGKLIDDLKSGSPRFVIESKLANLMSGLVHHAAPEASAPSSDAIQRASANFLAAHANGESDQVLIGHALSGGSELVHEAVGRHVTFGYMRTDDDHRPDCPVCPVCPAPLPTPTPTPAPTPEITPAPTPRPTPVPTPTPTFMPTDQPTDQPSDQPSNLPSGQPSSKPSGQPSSKPSGLPSGQPSNRPSGQPTGMPSSYPTTLLECRIFDWTNAGDIWGNTSGLSFTYPQFEPDTVGTGPDEGPGEGAVPFAFADTSCDACEEVPCEECPTRSYSLQFDGCKQGTLDTILFEYYMFGAGIGTLEVVGTETAFSLTGPLDDEWIQSPILPIAGSSFEFSYESAAGGAANFGDAAIGRVNVCGRGCEAFQTSALIISGIIEKSSSCNFPDAIELYALEDVPDLQDYKLRIDSQFSDASDDVGGDWTFPASGVINKGSFIYLTTQDSGDRFEHFFGKRANFTLTEVDFASGDDAIQLLLDGIVVDVFGVFGVAGEPPPSASSSSGNSGMWNYDNGFVYRNSGSLPSPIFDISQWNIQFDELYQECCPGSDSDSEATNSDCGSSFFPIATFRQEPPGSSCLIISGVVERKESAENLPDVLEFYAQEDCPNLSLYSILVDSRDGSSSASSTNSDEYIGGLWTFPPDSMNKGDFVYVESYSSAAGGSNFQAFFDIEPTYTTGPDTVDWQSGDDTIQLLLLGKVVDTFGIFGDSPGSDPSDSNFGSSESELAEYPIDWNYNNGWSYRNSGSAPTPDFNILEWRVAYEGLQECNTGTTVNADCGIYSFPLGTFNQDSKLIITGVVDSPGGDLLPFATELYVLQDLPTSEIYEYAVGELVSPKPYRLLYQYKFQKFDAQVDLPSYFPKGSHIWLVPRTETSEFDNYFGFRPTFEAYDNKTKNGDFVIDKRDPFALFRRGGVVDTFGVARAEWADQDWVKVPENGWAYRDSTSMTPSGSGFDSNSWTLSESDVLDGCDEKGYDADKPIPNVRCESVFPIGTFNGLGKLMITGVLEGGCWPV